MRIRLVLLTSLLCVLASSAMAQNPTFKIKGVGLDSSEAALKRAFGKPVKRKLEQLLEDDCSGQQTSLSIAYPGVTFELYGEANGKNAQVESFEVTGAAQMKLMGYPAGSTERQIRAKFRKKLAADSIEGYRVLTYVIDEDGKYANFFFKGGKLVKISIDTMLC